MKDQYTYPAIFEYADDGINVSFPDLPGCFTCGSNDEEALAMAIDALGGYMWSVEKHNTPIPTPTSIRDIALSDNQKTVIITAIMPPVRDNAKNAVISKTLTIPVWLNDLAKQHHINFSSVLQEALKQKLCIAQK